MNSAALVRVAEVVDDLADLGLDVVDTGDIVEGDPDALRAEPMGPLVGVEPTTCALPGLSAQASRFGICG